MTKFHTDGADLKCSDPFENAPESQPTGRIVFSTPVEKYPTDRALAAAFWVSYFALHWLTILGVVELTWQISGTTLFFFVLAALLSVNITAQEAHERRKK